MGGEPVGMAGTRNAPTGMCTDRSGQHDVVSVARDVDYEPAPLADVGATGLADEL